MHGSIKGQWGMMYVHNLLNIGLGIPQMYVYVYKYQIWCMTKEKMQNNNVL